MRKTATQINIERERKIHQERGMHDRIRFFFEKYTPSEPDLAAEFQADLYMITRQMHMDVSDTYIKHMVTAHELQTATSKNIILTPGEST